MGPQPLYNSRDQNPAYQLRYTWCGWRSKTALEPIPDAAWNSLSAAWESDGLRLLERSARNDRILLTFSATPQVSPVVLAKKAKGRFQHALNALSPRPIQFSRKLAVRTIGDNTSYTVRRYVESQVEAASFVDPRFAEVLRQFTIADDSIDLSQPSETKSGRYWYNLHLVLVTEGRFRFADEAALRLLRDGSMKIAAKKGYRIATLSVMPDHLHLALRGDITHPPEETALAFQNNLAFMLNRGPIWRPGYYVGTFGEYDMDVIRRRVRAQSASPATQGRGGRG